ncbi:GGDEF: diguanylate cyclase (GGDEF domain-containing protein) [Gaiella occulta]|uniref:GGDEF: diguanylate cyclase (GGDEF domain-containing protein) n=2 Tax=Gaiella occulta TaxID=1002870 RepID=A0A7M2YUC7_9ACTN|nr:GGDEF: diguanylate cyclase (GGDEF domain-containing protein) [Gaiella occulta]
MAEALIEQLPLIVYMDELSPNSSNSYTSPQTTAILGYTPEEWASDPDLFATILHPDDRARVLAEHAHAHATGETLRTDYRIVKRDGSEVWVHDEGVIVRDEHGAPVCLQGYMLDISERKLAEALAAGQARLLELVAKGTPLPEVLDAVTRFVEEQSSDVLASILLLDPDGLHLRHGAAPSLPDAYCAAIDGAAVGPSAGSCGTAAWRRARVDVSDIASDPLWSEYRDLALGHGLRACWSTPIFAADGALLGTFALYYREPRGCGERDLELVEIATLVAGIAIERARSEEEMRASEERYRDLFENACEPIATVTLDDVITDVNAAFERVLGYTRAELIGSNLHDYLTPAGRETSTRQRERKLAGDVAKTTFEQEFIAKGGRRVIFEVSSRIIEEGGRPIGVQGVCRDISARKLAEAEMRRLSDLNRHQALHDHLTGLPNRGCFRERIERAVAEGGGTGAELALLLIDLDRFKEINDALGHRYGDIILVELARRLESVVRRDDTVARLGNDEFGVLLPRLADPSTDLEQALARVLATLEQPFQVDALPLYVEVSIGVALSPAHGTDVELLLRRADIAMYAAKKAGLSHVLYAPHIDHHDSDSLMLLSELPRAVSQRELVLHYQPKVDIHTHELAGVEALVRWQHPTRGLIPPGEFIPLAEQTGIIQPLTRFVLDEALGQSKTWEGEGRHVNVAVNLSTRNLHEPTLPDEVAELLRKWDLPGERLTLEITESAIMSDPAQTAIVVEQLSALGIRISIDDFGVGYTSLAYLARLALGQVKIDRSFVAGMAGESGDAAIVRAIITLAHDLGLEVVAEGVETRSQWSDLALLGCDIIQGHSISRPLAARDLGRWLRRSGGNGSAQPCPAR